MSLDSSGGSAPSQNEILLLSQWKCAELGIQRHIAILAVFYASFSALFPPLGASFFNFFNPGRLSTGFNSSDMETFRRPRFPYACTRLCSISR
jgi:hypothetical protein